MKLQRTTMMAAYPHVGTKDFYAAADVDALLDSIRAAVAAERDATVADTVGFRAGTGGGLASVYAARAALDALLIGAAEVTA